MKGGKGGWWRGGSNVGEGTTGTNIFTSPVNAWSSTCPADCENYLMMPDNEWGFMNGFAKLQGTELIASLGLPTADLYLDQAS